MVARPDLPDAVPYARVSRPVGLAGFALLVVVGSAIAVGAHPVRVGVGVAVALAGAGPAFLGSPRLRLAGTVAGGAGVAAIGHGNSHSIVWFAVVVLVAWAGLAGGTRTGIVTWTGSALLFGGEWLWAENDPGWAPWIAGCTFSLLATLLVAHELAMVERLRAAQADLADRARIEERTRIARELHDVIAHSLTVSLLHVSSARLAVEHDPADAARALAEAERLGRQSLNEVRATMGLLRVDPADRARLGGGADADGDGGGGGGDGDEVSIPPPAPGFADVATLIDDFRRAGLAVSLLSKGDGASLPATVATTAYRIVQEALTNAAKHAPTAPVDVRIDVVRDQVDLRVDSAGPPGRGTGMGLLNMTERARGLGGSCTAGPGGRGWLVHARLPVPSGERAGR